MQGTGAHSIRLIRIVKRWSLKPVLLVHCAPNRGRGGVLTHFFFCLLQFLLCSSSFEVIKLARGERTKFQRCIHFISLFSFALNVQRQAAGWTNPRHSWGVITFGIYRPLLTLELRVNRKAQDVRINAFAWGTQILMLLVPTSSSGHTLLQSVRKSNATC